MSPICITVNTEFCTINLYNHFYYIVYYFLLLIMFHFMIIMVMYIILCLIILLLYIHVVCNISDMCMILQ